MDIEKRTEFNLLNEEVQKVVQQSKRLGSENVRSEQLIEFLKNTNDVCEFITVLLIILKCKYREKVSSYLWLIILSKLAKKDTGRLRSGEIRGRLMQEALVT